MPITEEGENSKDEDWEPLGDYEGSHVFDVDPMEGGDFIVQSPDSDKAHVVSSEENEIRSCSCKDWEIRRRSKGQLCKHMAAVKEQMSDQEAEPEEEEIEVPQEPSQEESEGVQLTISDEWIKDNAYELFQERIGDINQEREQIRKDKSELEKEIKELQEEKEYLENLDEELEEEIEELKKEMDKLNEE